ncbi:uncharacterized protein LOC125312840 [Rhodamnia argentea]|uniref:Uncharacterized protein LOC125312840 n=1 Tax=Rhodamnia argentea TaxID=178133 RepID=A0ABM3GVN1_9MYRT|nr:uncharacterized protein LOC125312840 [Rhodamnia argentea]
MGMIFPNEVEAYNDYAAYAIGKGFGVGKDKVVRNVKGEITRRTFVCNCEGCYASVSDKERKYDRFEVRCSCLAPIKFKVDNGVYEVIECVSEHNYALIPEGKKHPIRCGRMIPDSDKAVLGDMAKSSIRGTSSFKFLPNRVGGSQNLSYNLRDAQNLLQAERSNVISGGIVKVY